jgi:tRNA(Leu) C34 or U34 (ribose-2'-O)-methylase TrmL
MFGRLLCKLFGCKLHYVRRLGLYTQHARCRRCDKDYVVNFAAGTVKPWSAIFKDQHENRTPQR